MILIIFISLLLLEDLLLPALIGPGPFLITPIFILGLIQYIYSWKKLAFMALLLILVKTIFIRMDAIQSVISLAVVFLVYFGLSKIFNLRETVRNDVSFSGIIAKALFLFVMVLFYSFLFVFFDNSYNIIVSLSKWKIFFLTSWLSALSWCLIITPLLIYVFKEKKNLLYPL